MLIEFYKHETPFGPPVSHRISREEVIKVMAEAGFLSSMEFALGDNFYGIVLENGANKMKILILQTSEIENYPGSLDIESGPTLIERMASQVKKFGVDKVADIRASCFLLLSCSRPLACTKIG